MRGQISALGCRNHSLGASTKPVHAFLIYSRCVFYTYERAPSNAQDSGSIINFITAGHKTVQKNLADASKAQLNFKIQHTLNRFLKYDTQFL
jgi:hypothetical protein